MNTLDNKVDAMLKAARAEGLLAPDATLPMVASRPWPVVLLTALGAWLAAVPLMVFVGMLFGPLLMNAGGAYVIGVLLVAGAAVVLRSRGVPVFVEQLAAPALLAGAASLGYALSNDVGGSSAALLMGCMVLALAVVLPVPWLRVLLGASAMLLWAYAAGPGLRWFGMAHEGSTRAWWLALHALLVPWLLMHGALQTHQLRGRIGAAFESIATGWGLALLVTLALWSGMTFLVGGAFGLRDLSTESFNPSTWRVQQGVSTLLAAAGLGVAAWRWPTLRRAPHLVAGVVMVALAALMPSLGATLLMLALLVTSFRTVLATLAAVASAWIVGAFYYQTAWSLSTKALVLCAAGLVLAALAAWARPSRAESQRAGTAAQQSSTTGTASLGAGDRINTLGSRASKPPTRAWLWVMATTVAVLLVANVGIVQKERLIRDGRPVFVELAPIDPRSLMQGDFMALNFNIPGAGNERKAGLLRATRPRVVARVDARGVAQLLRIDHGEPLAPGELAIELTPKGGRWTLVTDAWFFAEGEAARWQAARYGEFRVDGNGRALLVGMRGPALEPL